MRDIIEQLSEVSEKYEKSVAKNRLRLEEIEYQLYITYLSNKFISKDTSLEISKNK